MINFLIHLILCLVLAFLFSKLWKDQNLKIYFWIGLSFKLLAGIALGGYYWYMVKTGDTYFYNEEAIKFTQLFKTSPLEYVKSLFGAGSEEFQRSLLYQDRPRALLFTRILSVIYILTLDNYWAAGLYFSLFSFIGLWLMTIRMIRLSSDFKWSSILAFLFYPSLVFWSSGIMKETLLMGAMGIVVYIMWGEWKKYILPKTLLLGMMLIFIWYLKYYIAALFFPVLIMILFGKLQKENKLSLNHYRLSMVLVPLILLLLSFLHPNLHLNRVYDIMIENHNELLDLTGGENAIEISTDSPAGVMRSMPQIYFLGWYGPIFNFEAPDLMIASLESMVLLILSILFIIKFNSSLFREHKWIVLPLLLYLLAATFFVTLSTPAYGTLVRYRVAYTCFLVFIILLHQPWIKYLRQKISFNR